MRFKKLFIQMSILESFLSISDQFIASGLLSLYTFIAILRGGDRMVLRRHKKLKQDAVQLMTNIS